MLNNFFEKFEVIDSNDECETYALMAVDSEKNRRNLIISIERAIA